MDLFDLVGIDEWDFHGSEHIANLFLLRHRHVKYYRAKKDGTLYAVTPGFVFVKKNQEECQRSTDALVSLLYIRDGAPSYLQI